MLIAKCSILILLNLCVIFHNGMVFARRRQGVRQELNSRTRFQQRINRLGASKLDLIRGGGLGKSRGLPSGFALIGGQVVDTTNKIVQKLLPKGTAYYSWTDQLGQRPLYIRPGNEAGWNFVVFQDPFYWRGSGHLLLFKKVLGVNINKSPYSQNYLYEAYLLSLRASYHPRVQIWDPAFHRKIQRRKANYQKILEKREKYKKSGGKPQIRPRTAKQGKRKRRSVFDFDTSLDTTTTGECELKILNATSMMLRLMKHELAQTDWGNILHNSVTNTNSTIK